MRILKRNVFYSFMSEIIFCTSLLAWINIKSFETTNIFSSVFQYKNYINYSNYFTKFYVTRFLKIMLI